MFKRKHITINAYITKEVLKSIIQSYITLAKKNKLSLKQAEGGKNKV
jgi:hypothetical protein